MLLPEADREVCSATKSFHLEEPFIKLLKMPQGQEHLEVSEVSRCALPWAKNFVLSLKSKRGRAQQERWNPGDAAFVTPGKVIRRTWA